MWKINKYLERRLLTYHNSNSIVGAAVISCLRLHSGAYHPLPHPLAIYEVYFHLNGWFDLLLIATCLSIESSRPTIIFSINFAACFSVDPNRSTDIDRVYPVSRKRQKDQHSPGDWCSVSSVWPLSSRGQYYGKGELFSPQTQE